MQILKAILMVSGGNAAITDAYGAVTSSPEIKIGISYEIDLDIRSNIADSKTGILKPYPYEEISAASGFYLAADGDWDHSTTPKLFLSAGIRLYQDSEGFTHLRAPIPPTAQTGIIQAVATNRAIALVCEIGGYAAAGSAVDAVFAFDFTLTIRNRIYIGDEVPESVVEDPDYLNASQVRAIIAEYFAAGLSIGNVSGGDQAQASITGTVPNQLLNLVLPQGNPGQDGRDGNDGHDGQDGATPQIDPTTKNWKIKGVDTGVCAEGQRGQRGEGLDYDASGTVAEKALYDDEPAGFKFASASINSTTRTTTLSIWTKLSAASADWSDALRVVFFSAESVAQVIAPIEFTPPPEGSSSEYYHFSMSQYPNAHVSAVSLVTEDGELILPYYSDLGIKKILKIGTECYIYFGRNIPEYTKGYIYLSQFVHASVSSAPDSGDEPGWEEETEVIYYGYIPAADASSLNTVADITQAMIEAAIEDGTVTRVEDNELEEEITVPRYGWMFVAVANDSSLVAKKDDGFGTQVAFAETNGVTGTSAANLKFYGEFSLVSATHTVYVSGSGS